jgi:hypothetical protein
MGEVCSDKGNPAISQDGDQMICCWGYKTSDMMMYFPHTLHALISGFTRITQSGVRGK